VALRTIRVYSGFTLAKLTGDYIKKGWNQKEGIPAFMFFGILLDDINQLSNDINHFVKRWRHCKDQEGICPYLLEYSSPRPEPVYGELA